MRGGTAEPFSRDQILGLVRGQGDIHFPCSADHEQDWQPYPVDPCSAICDDYTYTHCQSESCSETLKAQCGEDRVGRRKSGPTAYRATSGRLA